MNATPAWLRAIGAAVPAVVVLALGACSGSADAGSDDPTASESDSQGAAEAEAPSPDGDAQALIFAECMRENGVDMPDPGPGQDGFFDAIHSVIGSYDQTTIQEAISACEDLFPTYAGETHRGDGETALALADCLRDQGLDVPDNLFEDGALADIDPDELRAAMEQCRDVVSGDGL